MNLFIVLALLEIGLVCGCRWRDEKEWTRQGGGGMEWVCYEEVGCLGLEGWSMKISVRV